MRNTSLGPKAFSTGSTVNEPRAPIDSTQPENTSLSVMIVLKVVLLGKNPIPFVLLSMKEPMFFFTLCGKLKKQNKKNRTSAVKSHVLCHEQDLRRVPLFLHLSTFLRRKWIINSGGPETYTVCFAFVASWALSVYVRVLIKSDISVYISSLHTFQNARQWLISLFKRVSPHLNWKKLEVHLCWLAGELCAFSS